MKKLRHENIVWLIEAFKRYQCPALQLPLFNVILKHQSQTFCFGQEDVYWVLLWGE